MLCVPTTPFKKVEEKLHRDIAAAMLGMMVQDQQHLTTRLSLFKAVHKLAAGFWDSKAHQALQDVLLSTAGVYEIIFRGAR